MAYFDRTHGDSKPVFESDTLDQTATTGVPVNVAGPHLDFFGIDLGGDPSSQMGTGGAIEGVIKAIQQKATVYMYQVEASGTANNMSIGVYPVGAWTAGDLETAIQGLGTVNGYNLSGAAVTNVGFKLAAA